MLGLALALRSVVMYGASLLPLWTLPEVDARIFHESAQRIAAGDLLLGHDVLRLSPGYFYFLGGIYSWFGDGPLAFRLLQSVLGLLTIALTWETASILFGRRSALVVGIAIALYEPLAFYENLQLGETLAATLLSIVVWLCVNHAQRPEGLKLQHVAVVGGSFGLLCNLRPNALLLVLPLAIYAWLQSVRLPFARRVGVVVLLFASAALTMMPIAARNYAATSELTFTGHLAGLNLFVGNAPGATGSFVAPAEVRRAQGPEGQFAAFRAVAEREEGRSLTPKQVDSYWMRRTVACVIEDPGAWLSLMFKKTRLFFNGRDLSDVYDYHLLREYSPWLGLPAIQFHGLAPFALLGVLVLLTREQRAARFVSWIALTYAASIIVVFVSGRFRLPLVPVLFLGAGAVVHEVQGALRTRHARAWPLALALALTVYWTWPAKLKDKRAAESWFTLGQGFHRLRQFAEAEHAYRQALSDLPKHAPSRHNLAVLYETTGAHEAALEQWRSLLKSAAPGSPDATRAAQHIDKLSRAQP